MAVAKKYQPIVKNADGVLIGVAQVRVGKPSIRALGTASIGSVQQVPDSTVRTVTGVDGATSVVVVDAGTTLTSKTSTLAASGTYTGNYDGAFIVRFTDATTCDIFAPNGYRESGVLMSSLTNKNLKLAAATSSGVLLSGSVTTPAEGTTFVIPVWSGVALDNAQTGIVCPYSVFLEDSNSVGGLKSSSFTAKIDDIKTLSSGFPEEVAAKVVSKTSVTVSFEALEYSNTNIQYLKDAVNSMINDSKIPAIPIEVVMATHGGDLYSFWVPSATIETVPTYAPGNDFSSFTWTLSAIKQSASGLAAGAEQVIYDTWLQEANIYTENSYMH